MNIIFRHILVVFLLFVVAGAVFFCLLSGAFSVGHEMSDMQMSNDAFVAHILHAKELALATVSTSFFATSLFFLVVVVVLSSILAPNPFLRSSLLGRVRQKRHDIFSVSQQVIHHWLSLFELSPNSIKPT